MNKATLTLNEGDKMKLEAKKEMMISYQTEAMKRKSPDYVLSGKVSAVDGNWITVEHADGTTQDIRKSTTIWIH